MKCILVILRVPLAYLRLQTIGPAGGCRHEGHHYRGLFHRHFYLEVVGHGRELLGEA